MPLDPQEFYRHAVDAADDEQRLPLSRMTGGAVATLMSNLLFH